MIKEQDKKEIARIALETLKQYNKTSAFVDRKVADTPTDALSIVNRKYITNNGTVANRPVSSVAVVGQPYLATDTGIPMTYTSAGWVNGVGSIVAVNN